MHIGSRTENQSLNSTMVRLKPKGGKHWERTMALSQFHYGSIKTKKGAKNEDIKLQVSIPLWFD